MSKRLQLTLNSDAWTAVETLTSTANENFKNGRVTFSDAINEMIISAKVDIPLLQSKHINLRRSLRAMAGQDEIDIDLAIKTLMDFKSKTTKKGKQLALKSEV